MTLVTDLPRGTTETADRRIHPLPLDFVVIESNVRVVMAGLDELAASIAEQGVLQPIKVRHAADGAGYVVTWGHRRVLAARIAGLAEIPAFIDDVEQTAEDRAIEQLVENLHREDLNPIDRARAMRQVVDAGVTQADLARKLGLGSSTIANDLRLLDASAGVQAALEKGEITASHAKAMLPLPAKDQDYFIGRIRSGGLSAHRLEEEVGWKLQTIRGEEASAARATKQAPKLVAALEAAGIAKTTLVNLRTSYNMRGEIIESAIKKAGWKLGDRYAYPRDRGASSKCDCDVVRVEFNRTWQIQPACTNDSHHDRQVNHDHVAEEKRRKAIQTKLARLGELVAVLLDGLPPELVKLLSATHRDELVEAWAREDLPAARSRAGQRIAAAADTTYVYPDTARPAHDATLDQVIEAFEALAAARAA